MKPTIFKLITLLVILFTTSQCLWARNGDSEKETALNRHDFGKTGWTIKGRAIRDFEKRFPGIENEKWYEGTKYLEVKFDKDDINGKVLYSLKGHFIYAAVQYNLTMMDQEIKRRIRIGFPDYKIQRIYRVSNETRDKWVIIIESLTSQKAIAITEKDMEVIDESEFSIG